MKNLHLVPPIVIDLADKLSNNNIVEHERINYEMRLEAIRDYCTTVLNTSSRDRKSFLDKKTKSNLNHFKVDNKNS